MKKLSIFFAGFLCLLFTSCSKKDSQPLPIADFSISVASDAVPAKVKLTNLSSGAITYSWNFGNGETSIYENPEYTYMSPGTYEVTLSVTNGGGTTHKKETIVVKPAYTQCDIKHVKIDGVPLDDNGSAWDFDGTTPDLYFRIKNSSGAELFTAPTYYIDPQTLPLQWDLSQPLSVSPLSTVLELEVLDFDSGFYPDVMGGISFVLSIPQIDTDNPYPTTWQVVQGEVNIELGLEWK